MFIDKFEVESNGLELPLVVPLEFPVLVKSLLLLSWKECLCSQQSHFVFLHSIKKNVEGLKVFSF